MTIPTILQIIATAFKLFFFKCPFKKIGTANHIMRPMMIDIIILNRERADGIGYHLPLD